MAGKSSNLYNNFKLRLFQDDDYFLAGNYGGAIGNLESDEAWANMDRAVTSNDPNNRFHFLLSMTRLAYPLILYQKKQIK